jgi:hypothetical protein
MVFHRLLLVQQYLVLAAAVVEQEAVLEELGKQEGLTEQP